ncbi:unnamed protein product [Caenorhabditis brenneri]
MECNPSIHYYCGHFVIYEKDYHKTHDPIKDEYFCTTEKIREVMYPEKKFEEYEFRYQLTHNCTSTGKTRCVEPTTAVDVPVVAEHSVVFNIPLFNYGQQGACRQINVD